MRQKQVRASSRKKLPGPLVEIPLNGHGHRNWQSLSDDEVVAYAQKYVDRGIKNRYGLEKEDRGLHGVLKKRTLLDRIEFEEKKKQRGNWKSMSDEELIEHAQKIVDKGIKTRSGLQKAHRGLYRALYRRKLLARIQFEERKGNWESIPDEEVLVFAQNILAKGIINRKGLNEENPRLYAVLYKRKLLARIQFEERRRNWKSVPDEELIEHAQKIVDKGIKNRSALQKKDHGLYQVLQKRKLLDKIKFEERLRNWKSVPDEELIEHAQKIVDKGLKNRSALQKKDPGLYFVLSKRNLLDRMRFEEKRETRNWKSFTDEELIEHAQLLVRKGIKNRKALRKEDSGLYCVLISRKLLDRIEFEDKKRRVRDWESLPDQNLLEHTQNIVDRGLKNRSRLAKLHSGLYKSLYRRKLIDKIKFEEEQRNWRSMSDEELIAYAQKIIEEKKIKDKKSLMDEDHGLHAILWRRKLLDQVFAPFEQENRKQALDEIVEAVEAFK